MIAIGTHRAIAGSAGIKIDAMPNEKFTAALIG